MYDSPYSRNHTDFLLSIEDKFLVKNELSRNKWARRSELVDLIYSLTKDHGTNGTVIYFHALSCLDRIVDLYPTIELDKLLALSCFTLACKWDDENVIDLASISKLVSLNDLWQAETYVWQSIEYDMLFSNPMHFLRYYSYHCDGNEYQVRTRAKMILFISSHHPKFYRYKTSKLAAAALYLGKKSFMTEGWIEIFEKVTKYSPHYDLSDVLMFMISALTCFIDTFDNSLMTVMPNSTVKFEFRAPVLTDALMKFHGYTRPQDIHVAIRQMLED